MPKATSSRSAAAARRHNPLADDLLASGHLRTKSSSKRKSRQTSDDEGEHYIDAKASRKILQIGQDLAEEDAAETRAALGQTEPKINSAFQFESRFEDEDNMSDDGVQFGEEEWGSEEEVEEVVCC
jgi:hypothetical protein